MATSLPASPNVSRSHPNLRRRRWGIGTSLLIVTLIGGSGWGVFEALQPRRDEHLSVLVPIDGQQRNITVDCFLPALAAGQRAPAIVLLHGVEGPRRYWRSRNRTADMLRDQGYAVFIVHYLDAVDYDDLWLLNDANGLDVDAIDQIRLRDQPRWMQAVTAALATIAKRPEIDAQRLAIDGYSLGGFLALAVAAECQADAQLPDPSCVVVNWGAYWRQTKFAPGFPPTLFVHGEFDTVVPLSWARETAQVLDDLGTETELVVVPGAGHVARSPESDAATQEFLATHLRSQQLAWPQNEMSYACELARVFP